MHGQTEKMGTREADGTSSRTYAIKPYLWTFLSIVAVAGIGGALDPFFDRINLALLFLLPVLISAVRWGLGPSFFASALGVSAFDFFFIPPYYSFAGADVRYVVTFAVVLLVAGVTGTLANRLRREAQRATQREKKTLALYALGREIAAETDLQQVLTTFVTTIAEAVNGETIIMMPDSEGGPLREIASWPAGVTLPGEKGRAVAHWVFVHGQDAGQGTDTLRGGDRTFFPIIIEEKTLAVLAVRFKDIEGDVDAEKRLLIEAFANLGAVAIIRVQLAREAEQAKWLAESEKLHTALLNSVSHDLRTPLAAITGAVTAILSTESVVDHETEQVLLQTIKEGAQRMNRYVANLLDMVRLEGGTLKLKEEWCDIQDVLGVALREIKDSLQGRPLSVSIPPDLPLVMADFALIEHVIINLVENAAKYSPPQSEISISAQYLDKAVRFIVTDRSPPVPPTERERVFDRFYRLHYSNQVSGTGLGLSICKGIIEAHGGAIWVDPYAGYGNQFTFSLPVSGQPPETPGHEEGEDHGD